LGDGHKYITERLRNRCTPDVSPELRAVMNEAATVIDGRDAALRADRTFLLLQSLVRHWDEFGPEYGLDEKMDAARSHVNRAS